MENKRIGDQNFLTGSVAMAIGFAIGKGIDALFNKIRDDILKSEIRPRVDFYLSENFTSSDCDSRKKVVLEFLEKYRDKDVTTPRKNVVEYLKENNDEEKIIKLIKDLSLDITLFTSTIKEASVYAEQTNTTKLKNELSDKIYKLTTILEERVDARDDLTTVFYQRASYGINW